MWQRDVVGKSDAQVWRGDGVYRKVHKDAAIEAAKLTWLRSVGVPAPAVLDVGDGWLLMAEVPGRSAAEPWPAEVRTRVVDALADLARTLHALPVADCPYDRTLAVTIPAALEAAAAGAVDLDDLDPERRGWTTEMLAAELLRTRPTVEDVVVTHGDLCVPNVLLDPGTAEVTGVIDVGRAGRADRYVDLALATRSLTSDLNPQYGPWAAARFLRSYGVDPEPARLDFYRLLDEFG